MRSLRKPYKSYKTKTKKNSKSNAFLYPFSSNKNGTKIPDGRVIESKGERFQYCGSFSATQTGVSYIALLPSSNIALAFNLMQATIGNPTDNVAEWGGDNEMLNFLPQQPPGQNPIPAPENVGTWQISQYPHTDITSTNEYVGHMGLAKWRLVSTAMKIGLVNRWEHNEGYFEAIRFSLGTENTRSQSDALVTFLNDIINVNFIDQPSYTTDTLKNIQKYTFQCKPDGMNHKFSTITDNLDNSFDGILIRIHGRVSADDSPDKTLTHLVVETVSNQELVFATSHMMSKYMTRCNYDPTFEAKSKAKAIDVKAGHKSK
jgi:hypothetical protein